MSLMEDLAPFGPEWAREQEHRMYGEPVYTMADHHSAWHAANGRWSCPWDCADSDPGDPEAWGEILDGEPLELGEEVAPGYPWGGLAPGDPWNTDPEPPF
jgi:hypothetical protein